MNSNLQQKEADKTKKKDKKDKKGKVKKEVALSPYERVMQLSEKHEALKDFGVVNETAFSKVGRASWWN